LFYLVKSAETEDGRKNLKPIEDLLQCCGATIETKQTYIKENLCPGELKDKVKIRVELARFQETEKPWIRHQI